jgi:predicted DNA binding CopG/RHH family protein
VQKAAKKRPRGRPRTGKIRMQVKLSPQANKLIKQRASKLGISRSEYIERVVLEANL